MKKALITGITGQDGAYLTELLLSKGYQVYGTYRRTSSVNFWRVEELGIRHHPNLHLTEYDLTDAGASLNLINRTKPDEVYNLAAQSFVPTSWSEPVFTAEVTAVGATRMLEAMRTSAPEARYYQASTSEMFGKSPPPQNEDTPFHPRSPYGVAKLYAHWITVNFREAYGLFACNGILFNHVSPRRGETFVTRKITRAATRIKLGLQDKLFVVNLDAKRDWGFAGDYVDGMWRMLQQEQPDTYVLATNRTESVRDFVEMAFRAVGMTLRWEGTEERERGLCARTGREIVAVNPAFTAPRKWTC